MTKANVAELKTHGQHKDAWGALLASQPHFDAVSKDAENTHFKNKYATLKALMDAVLPTLNRNGLVLSQPIVGSEIGYSVKTILFHPESGTEVSTEVPMLMGKQDMQQFKSASTYARRVGIENLTGVSAGEDDDAETNRQDNSMGAALKDAWRQGVEDQIPANATPADRAKVYADAICEDFAGKGEKALMNRWNKHKSIIGGMEVRFPELHGQIVDAYETRLMAVMGQD